ncbi:MAG TPA: hypothetical protein VMU77_03880 [Acidimicrobiales bacterium]|nr:hypothetical protein [Acidimicrobiales bacterium]
MKLLGLPSLILVLVIGISACSSSRESISSTPGSIGSSTPRSASPSYKTSQWSLCSAGTSVSDPTGPHGLFASNVNVMQPSVIAAETQYLMSGYTICGANIVVPWSSVDQGPGASPRYNWNYVDQLAAPWEAAGKIVNLIVWGVNESISQDVGGQLATPSYVLSSTQTVSCGGKDPTTPVYWDSGYLNPYRAFEAALVSHFASDPHIGYIRFGLGAGAEDYPADSWYSPICKSKWIAAGLTPSKWLSYSVSQIDYEAGLNSTKPLFVGINAFPNAPTLADQVANEAVIHHIGFGMQGLTDSQVTSYQQGKLCFADWCNLFLKYAGTVPLELQTFSASNPLGAGKTGALPQQLSFGITTTHAQVWELYPQEWLVADDPSWPGYSQFHQAYSQALASAATEVGGQK